MEIKKRKILKWKIALFLLIGLILLYPIFMFADAPIGTPSGNSSLRVEVAPICGNGVQQSGEDCDGADLGGGTCENQGFDSGTLLCTGSCSFDTSGCTSKEGGGGRGGGG